MFGDVKFFFLKLFRTLRDKPAFFGLCIVALAEAGLNATYGASQAHSAAYGALFVGIYAGSEIAKWFAAEGLGNAWQERATVRAVSWFVMLVCCLSLSLSAHIGAIGLTRDTTTARRDNSVEERRDAKVAIERDRAALSKLGATRAPDQVVQDQKRAKEGSSLWNRLEAERLAAVRAVDLMKSIGAAEHKLQVADVTMADTRVQVLKWIWRETDEADLNLALSVAMACAVEMLTAIGFVAVGGARPETLDVETLIRNGAITHAGSEHVLPFRSEALEAVRGEVAGEDDVFKAYAAWCRAHSKPEMSRPAFFRLLEALGVKRDVERAVFTGVRIRPRWLLERVA